MGSPAFARDALLFALAELSPHETRASMKPGDFFFNGQSLTYRGGFSLTDAIFVTQSTRASTWPGFAFNVRLS